MTIDEIEARVQATGRAPIDVISAYCAETGESFEEVAGAFVFVTVIEQASEKLAPALEGERASDLTLAWIEEGNTRTPHADVCDPPENAHAMRPHIFGETHDSPANGR